MKDFNKLEIEKIIGYNFGSEALLLQAFTHSSFYNGNKKNSNERLEFVGDAALGYIIAEELLKRYPEDDEGFLTKARAAIVSQNTLGSVIENLDLMKYLRVGQSDKNNNIGSSVKKKCDLFESIIGAILLDGNYELSNCRAFILKFLNENIKNVKNNKANVDYKSKLLEECAKEGKEAEFISKEETLIPNPQFSVALLIDKKEVSSGKGKSKKEAEKDAAKSYFEGQNK